MKKLLLFTALTFLLCTAAFAKTFTSDLFPDEQMTHTLAEYEDLVKYTLYIEEDGIFTLKIASMTSTSEYAPKVSVTLKDKGTVLTSFKTGNDSLYPENYYLYEGLKEGEYTLEVRNETRFGDVEYVMDTSFIPWDYVEAQRADTPESATVMEFSKRYKGGVMQSDVKDYFTFTMPKDGYAVIDMYSSDLKFFTLYNSKLEVIGEMHVMIDEPDKVFETRCGLEKGQYFISITPETSFINPEYALEVTAYYDTEFESEYNNTYKSADELTVGKERRGNIFGYDDVDVYSFTLGKKSNITATLTDLYLESSGHYDFSILDSDGSPIVTRTTCNTYSFNETLDKGTYYLEVACSGERYYTAFGYKVKVSAVALPEEEQDKTEDNVNSDVSDDVSKDTEDTKEDSSEDVTDITPEVLQFDDVHSDSWYASDILKARRKGLIEGMDGNNFAPMSEVTVAQAITMASRMYEKFSGAEINLSSVDGAWYNPYVLYAVAAGIINADDFEDYNRPATRAEMAYVFAGVTKHMDIPEAEVSVPDVKETDSYSKEIYTLYKLGILTGVDEKGTFNPSSNITRAESAVIMLRVSEKLGV